jgi:ferritin-like metal-binding protein YciE
MHLTSAHIETLKTLYITELQKSFDMEQKIVKALPDMVKAAHDQQLKNAFETHLQQTMGHLTKVEGLLRDHKGSVTGKTCKVIEALVSEASATIKDVTDPEVRDVALISAGQQIEHHEIAFYGGLRRWANILGFSEDEKTLKSIEEEEGQTDQLLSKIAGSVNPMAPA